MDEKDYKELYHDFIMGGYDEEFTFAEYCDIVKRCGSIERFMRGYMTQFDVDVERDIGFESLDLK